MKNMKTQQKESRVDRVYALAKRLLDDQKLMLEDMRNFHRNLIILTDIVKKIPGYQEALDAVQKEYEEAEIKKAEKYVAKEKELEEQEGKIGKNTNKLDDESLHGIEVVEEE